MGGMKKRKEKWDIGKRDIRKVPLSLGRKRHEGSRNTTASLCYSVLSCLLVATGWYIEHRFFEQNMDVFVCL